MTIRKPRAPRWTADTELAFLMALRLTGSPVAACDAIGRSPQGTYKRRRENPEFARRWQETVDELQRDRARARADAAGGIAVRRVRHDGFTPLRRRAFLRALSDTGRFDAAAKHVGVSVSGVTKLRRRDPGFDADCAAALARSSALLEQAAIERAVNGVAEPVYHAGARIGERRRFSDGLLRYLIARDDARAGVLHTPEQRVAAAQAAARVAGGTFEVYPTAEETDKAINAILDKLERKKRGQEREAAWAAEGAARAAEFTTDLPALPAPDDSDEPPPAAIRSV